MAEITDKPSASTPGQDASQALSNEFVGSKAISAPINNNACRTTEEMRESMQTRITDDGDKSRGTVLNSLLESISRSNKYEPLTANKLAQEKESPCYNQQEKQMIDFAAHNIKALSGLDRTDASKDAIAYNDIQNLKSYPKATMDIEPNYKEKFTEKSAKVGIAAGIVVEAGAMLIPPNAGIGISVLAGYGAGGLKLLQSGDPIDAGIAGVAVGAAWGPLLGYKTGEYIGNKIAEPYWNMTQGRKINTVFDKMHDTIPTYGQYKAALRH